LNYAWYSRVPRNANLQQGDFVECFALPVATYTYEQSKNKVGVISSHWLESNWIVLTQSCDLDPEINRGINSIMLCPVFTFEKFLEDNPNYTGSKKKSNRQNIISNKVVGLHSLKATGYANLPDSPYVVNLREAKIASLDVVLEHIKSSKKKTRLRLNPPYAEQLAMRFGLIFSRIGYPIDFPTEIEKENI